MRLIDRFPDDIAGGSERGSRLERERRRGIPQPSQHVKGNISENQPLADYNLVRGAVNLAAPATPFVKTRGRATHLPEYG
jgi:hypothetical protein